MTEESLKNDEETSYASLSSRILAKIIDLFIVFLLTLSIAIPLNGIVAAVKVNDFRIYINYISQNPISLIQARDQAINNDNFLFSCKNTEDPEKCKIALQYAKNQTAIVIGILIFVYILYFSLLTNSKIETTLGKFLLKIRVVSSNLGRPSLIQAITREVLMILIFVVTLFSVYYPSIRIVGEVLELLVFASIAKVVFSKDKTAIHDNLAYTKVIKK